jgi:hypothetical protein
MKTVIAALGALICFGVATQAHAAPIKPGQGVETQVGAYSLISFFVPNGPDLRVITTAQRLDDEPGVPFRIEAMLRAGQETTLSVPQGVGEAPVSITIVRVGDTIELHSGGTAE